MMLCSEIYESWMEDAQERKIDAILKRMCLRLRQPALDIGSGPGFLERRVDAVAVDVDLKNLKKCRGARVLASGDALPFKDGSFKTVFCIDSLHLLKSAGDALRVLAEGGRLAAAQFCSQYNKDEKLAELKKKLQGFEIEDEFLIEGSEWEAVAVGRKR